MKKITCMRQILPVSVIYGVKGIIADMAWNSGARSFDEKLRSTWTRISTSGRQFASEPYPRLFGTQARTQGHEESP